MWVCRLRFGYRLLGRPAQLRPDAQHYLANIVAHDPVIRINATTPPLRLEPGLIEYDLVDRWQLAENYWIECNHGNGGGSRNEACTIFLSGTSALGY